jgi:lysophospholipase L1-like esterase
MAVITPARPRRRRKTLWGLVLLGLFLTSGAWGYRQYWLARPLGEGPAGPDVPREAFATPWTDRKILLLGLGDSVTAGFGVDREHTYFQRLISNPADESPDMQGVCLRAVLPGLQSLNLAESGSTSAQAEAAIQTKLATQPADVFGLVVVTTGGNDLIHDYGRRPAREGAMYGAALEESAAWIEGFQRRLDRILAQIDARFPGGCLIFLADIYDPTDGVGDAASAGLPPWPDGPEIHRRYNAILHAAADRRKHVVVAPLCEEFRGHGTHCAQFWRSCYRPADPSYWYGANLEDPNIRGYDAVRRLFLRAIAAHRECIAAAP